jgi:hypothetical protein
LCRWLPRHRLIAALFSPRLTFCGPPLALFLQNVDLGMLAARAAVTAP